MRKKTQIRILFAEDLDSDYEIAVREIRKENIDFDCRLVDTEEDFVRELEHYQPDIIVSDYSMPGFDGMRALEITRRHSEILPLILLTGSLNEEIAVKCMKEGANDYVIKEHINRLPFAIQEAVEAYKVRKDKLEADRKLQLLSRSVEQSPVSIIITDKDGNIEYVNPTFSRVSGYGEEVIGENPRILSSGEQTKDFYETLWNTILSGEDWSGELKNRRKDGSFYWENASISPILDEEGKITHFVGVKEDITSRKKMINELVAAKEKAEESDRLKSAFLANMSHEIRTPLNGILGFLEILQRPDIPTEDRENYSEIVKKSSDRLLITINDLIEISRIESGLVEIHVTRVNVNATLEYFYQFFKPDADSKKLELTIEQYFPEEYKIISTDKNKFEAIVSNLLRNAVKFTKKGYVRMGCSLTSDHQLHFYVKDSGIGISPGKVEAIFDRFVQAEMGIKRSHEGSGLGLSISKAYAEMLDGRIWVESEEGSGTTFHLVIPFAPENEKQTEPDEVIETPKPSQQRTILVAEDEPDNFAFLEVVLKGSGYRIIHARDGKEAVRLYNEHPGISLVLMDIKMPVMDGLEATREIRKQDPDVFIIAQTGYALSGDRQKALDAGCNDYLAKPIHPKDLLKRLGIFLND